ncbi:MAG: T9SS type A sorting domain-containing protein [Bacteroidetes bacterium]|nr:T9SS type A sorting domain-containing protein [Bacteroidota bacterium]
MKKLFIIFSGILLSFMVSAQPCLHEGRGFYTQEDINSFHTDNPNCTEIQGDVIISGTDITNLDSLRGVVAIDGYLEISHTELLGSLSGLDSLRTVGGHFGIYTNLALNNLSGLSHLRSVGGNFEIFDNPVLASLKGLDTLASVAKNLWIGSNPLLVKLNGLHHLGSIGGLLQINDNGLLKDLVELHHLKDLGAELVIYSNMSLHSLSGLDSIHPGMLPSITVYNNDSLSVCDVYSICRYLEVPWANVTINNNRIGCNSRAEVKTGCDTLGVETHIPVNPFIVYPNPTHGSLTIQIANQSSGVQISLLDISGREMLWAVVNEPETTLDLGKLPGGIYFMRVLSGDRSFTLKVVKF